MKINSENLKDFYVTKRGNLKKGNNIYVISICEQCGSEFLKEKHVSTAKYCCKHCASISKTHKNPIPLLNIKRKERRKNQKFKYYNNPKICKICGKNLSYDQNLRGCITCSHKCSQELKWKNEEYTKNMIKKMERGWEKKFNYNSEEYNGYMMIVRRLSMRNYKKFKEIINPNNLQIKKGEYNLDHKLSILDGFLQNISSKLVSHPYNLQVIKEIDNLKKGYKSSISKTELEKIITEKNLFK